MAEPTATAGSQGRGGKFQMEVPLDASGIEGFKPDQPVQVLVQGGKGPLGSTLVKLDDKGRGVAKFAFAEAPGGVRVILGPHDATLTELAGLQTIGVDIPARRWTGPLLKLSPIVISPYYWYWWYIWCRLFTICGKVVCPDGSPVVGATVCAYDVDWWWWYSSTQQIACATTDINGTFCMKFKWCCGWWPWWWWETKIWELNPHLVDRVTTVLQRNPDLGGLVPRTAQPSLADFHGLLRSEAAHLSGVTAMNPSVLADLGPRLVSRLPQPDSEIAKLKLWPWYPWYPWQDCAPDVIFKVTQNCGTVGDTVLIVDEGVGDTRPDIPTTLNNVTLVANDKACCLPPSYPCIDPECLDLTLACSFSVNTIGGNPLAPATPIGYQAPGVSTTYSDRPFGGLVPISGTSDCMNTVDYYEFEWATSSGGPWNAMPPNANGAIQRQYIKMSPLALPVVWFNPQSISGRNVYETLKHYELGHASEGWYSNSWWYWNRDVLINWLTHNFTPGDGTYYLRVKGYDSPTAGTLDLASARVLNMCGTNNPNYIVLTIDNRFVGPGPNDAHGFNCQSVHTCTNEPDTAFVPDITILRAGGGTESIVACGVHHVRWPDQVQIDFVAYDPDGYLAEYALNTYYDDNLSRNLLGHPSTLTLSPGSFWSGVPAALQAGPTYAHAVVQGGAGIRPFWRGGVLRLVMPATDDPGNPLIPQGAFPKTCCYQLRLDALKRTIVGCNGLFGNTSEKSFTIIVDP